MGTRCAKCGEIEVDGAQQCRYCGYDAPQEHKKAALLVVVLGIILTPGIIGLFFLGYGVSQYEEASKRRIYET